MLIITGSSCTKDRSGVTIALCFLLRLWVCRLIILFTLYPTYNREWTAKQRQKYTQGRLSADRQELLNTVGFVYRINRFIKRKSTAREDKKVRSRL